jgi:hypothetical protein
MVIHAVKGAEEARQVLRHALQRCATMPDVNEQAWTMRHAFDAVLGKDNN